MGIGVTPKRWIATVAIFSASLNAFAVKAESTSLGPPYFETSTDHECSLLSPLGTCTAELLANLQGDIDLHLTAESPAGGIAPGIVTAAGGAGVKARLVLGSAVPSIRFLVKLEIESCEVHRPGGPLDASGGTVYTFTLIEHDSCSMCTLQGDDAYLCDEVTEAADTVDLEFSLVSSTGVVPAGQIVLWPSIVGDAGTADNGLIGVGRVVTEARVRVSDIRAEWV